MADDNRAISLTPELWNKAKDIVVLALVPGFMWLTSQTQKSAELNFEISAHKAAIQELSNRVKTSDTLAQEVSVLKAQLEESKTSLQVLRQDYNALNIQMVEVKGALRSIQESLTSMREQLKSMDDRQRAFEAEIRGRIPQAHAAHAALPPYITPYVDVGD